MSAGNFRKILVFARNKNHSLDYPIINFGQYCNNFRQMSGLDLFAPVRSAIVRASFRMRLKVLICSAFFDT